MDEAVKKLTLALCLATPLATILANLPAAAQTLADPTRPPAMLDASRPEGAGDGLPRLQSILISPRTGGRHVAVIDGETVRLGGSFRGARVARMTENQVELVRGRERQVLRLDAAEAAAAGMTPAAQ